MRDEAALAYSQLLVALEGIDEGMSWATPELQPGTYLHTNGSIIGIVQHIALCKFIFGSCAFRNLEVRWRDGFDRLEAIGTSWTGTVAYLAEAHEYWMSTWFDLEDEDLAGERMRFSGDLWPAWKLIATVTQHDVYHGGQISLLGSLLAPVSTPPDLKLDEERTIVMSLPSW
jgi:hypothetical protein